MSEPTEFQIAAERCQTALELLHVVGYFAPEPREAYEKLGLNPLLAYFPARAAALGPASAELTVATFYVFSPRLVEMILPAAWDITSPEQLVEVRRSSVGESLHRLLGSPDVDEAVELARTACAGLMPGGRPLYAAHASLPWPGDPLLALWHAASLLREHRGDGHIAALLMAGLDPVEAIALHGPAAGATKFLKATRGWTPEEWTAGEDRLRARGLLDADAALTEAGAAFKADLEARTVTAARGGWERLGPAGTARLAELLKPLRRQLLDSADLFPRFIQRTTA